MNQIIIPIDSENDTSFESFYSTRNQPLIAQLKSLLASTHTRRVLYLWGEGGSGKTHLLNAFCVAAEKAGRRNLYVSLKQYGGQNNRLDMLSEVDKDTLVCIDDLQEIAASESWQKQIFSLYEKITNGTGAIVVSGTSPMSSIGIVLKDIESRLSSGGIFNIYALDDDEKQAALKLRAARRGFVLDDNVIGFIMSHYQRDTKSLFTLLDKLDSASLRTHRKITVPFVKALMYPS